MIINLERFLYSKANMIPNPIKVENRYHAQMEGGYSVMLRDQSMSPSLRAVMEEKIELPQGVSGKKQEAKNIIGNCGKINCYS